VRLGPPGDDRSRAVARSSSHGRRRGGFRLVSGGRSLSSFSTPIAQSFSSGAPGAGMTTNRDPRWVALSHHRLVIRLAPRKRRRQPSDTPHSRFLAPGSSYLRWTTQTHWKPAKPVQKCHKTALAPSAPLLACIAPPQLEPKIIIVHAKFKKAGRRPAASPVASY